MFKAKVKSIYTDANKIEQSKGIFMDHSQGECSFFRQEGQNGFNSRRLHSSSLAEGTFYKKGEGISNEISFASAFHVCTPHGCIRGLKDSLPEEPYLAVATSLLGNGSAIHSHTTCGAIALKSLVEGVANPLSATHSFCSDDARTGLKSESEFEQQVSCILSASKDCTHSYRGFSRIKTLGHVCKLALTPFSRISACLSQGVGPLAIRPSHSLGVFPWSI